MEILFISKYIRTIVEGTPTRHYFFCKNLAKLGHNVNIIKSRASFAAHIPDFKGYFKKEEDSNVSLITINAPMIPRGFSLKRLWTWVTFELGVIRYIIQKKELRPDVIVVSSLSIFTFLTGIWLKRRYKVPLIVEVRDIYPLTLTEVAGYKKYNPLIMIMARIEKMGYSNADYIVSSLEKLDEHVRTIIGSDFNFKCIPTGFENGLYESLTSIENSTSFKVVEDLKSQGNFIIGYAGTIGLANALDVIFESAILLEEKEPNLKYVIIGNGPLKEHYIEKYGHLKNLVFVDFVKKQFLPGLLQKCDILINTWKKSRMYQFGISPNKWNEYMYSERPFILSHDYSSRIFNEANCGWQIPTNDLDALVKQIQYILSMNPDDISKMGKNGKDYLLEKLSYQYLSGVYEEVLTKSIKNYKL